MKYLKILIGVVTCHKFNYSGKNTATHKPGPNPRVKAIRSTWLKDTPYYADMTVKFFYGQAPPAKHPKRPLPDEVFLPVSDDYEHLPDKVISMVHYALDNGYDYLLKVDDDTAVYVHRLAKEVMKADFDYAGRLHGDMVFGGAGYWLSRKAMLAVKNNPDTTMEDGWISKCMKAAGIEPTILPDHLQFSNQTSPTAVIINGFDPKQMVEWYAKANLDPSVELDTFVALEDVEEEVKSYLKPWEFLQFVDLMKRYEASDNPRFKEHIQDRLADMYPYLLNITRRSYEDVAHDGVRAQPSQVLLRLEALS